MGFRYAALAFAARPFFAKAEAALAAKTRQGYKQFRSAIRIGSQCV